MKIYAIGLDMNSISVLKENQHEVISSLVIPEANIIEDAVLILTSDEIHFTELEEIKNKYPLARIFYKSNQGSMHVENNIFHICKGLGIDFLAKRSTTLQILDALNEEDQSMKENNILGFFGAKPGIGVTSVAMEYARIAATTLNVLFIGLNLYDAGIYRDMKLNLTEIKPRLTNRLLKIEDVESIPKHLNYRVINGNHDILLADDFTEEEIKYLLEFISPQFDLVIVDCGAIPHSPSWFTGLRLSGLRYMIINEESISKAAKVFEIANYVHIPSEAFQIIVNDQLSNYTTKDIERELNSFVALQIPYTERRRNSKEIPIHKKDQENILHQIKSFLNLNDTTKKGFLKR